MSRLPAPRPGLAILIAAPLLASGLALAVPALAKDVGPASTRCDAIAKATPAWTACLGEVAAMPEQELFYAGYWLARSGQYEAALAYLKRARQDDERVLTYIGFATRKLGAVDAALGYYERALALNPGYVVARAYMGEAFLQRHELGRAEAQLSEIETRCGRTCPAYADLAGHLEAYKARRQG